MKHTQNEEVIGRLLDDLTEFTHLYKSGGFRAPVSDSGVRYSIRRNIRKKAKTLIGFIRKRLFTQPGRKETAPKKASETGTDLQYDYFSDEQIAVYMAPFGKYDQIREPVCHPDNIDYYILTDQELPPESDWKKLSTETCVPEEFLADPVMANRWCKLHPHLIFPDHRISIYVDSNYLITSDLTALANLMKEYPAAMFRHKKRNCVYEEIAACIEQKKDREDRLLAHGRELRKKGIPERNGLLEAPVIVRRHSEEECIRLMDTWWNAFCRGCRRDQIALIEALWDLGISPDTLAVLGDDFRDCDLFITFRHIEK